MGASLHFDLHLGLSIIVVLSWSYQQGKKYFSWGALRPRLPGPLPGGIYLFRRGKQCLYSCWYVNDLVLVNIVQLFYFWLFQPVVSARHSPLTRASIPTFVSAPTAGLQVGEAWDGWTEIYGAFLTPKINSKHRVFFEFHPSFFHRGRHLNNLLAGNSKKTRCME